MIIAIDGPAGTGKSSLAKMIAKDLGFHLLNTGLFYRALTYQMLQFPQEQRSKATICQVAKQTDYQDGENQFFINNHDVYPWLRTAEIDAYVSQISSIPEVREILNTKMRQAKQGNIVCEGRDTTTIVFPHAEVKIYLDASAHVRALRRFKEQCSDLSLEEIEQNITKRDEQDKNKPVGALILSKDAIYIDSSGLTLNEVYEKLKKEVLSQFCRSK